MAPTYLVLTQVYLLLMLGNHGDYRVIDVYPDKKACEAVAVENNKLLAPNKHPSKEWFTWEHRCFRFSGMAPKGPFTNGCITPEKPQ